MNSSSVPYTVEEQKVRQKALIIADRHNHLIAALKESLVSYDIEVFISPEIPERLNPYTILFVINPSPHEVQTAQQYPSKRFIFIFLHSSPLIKECAHYVHKKNIRNVKLIHMKERQQHIKEDIDKIFWFSFSRSNEIYLHIYHPDVYTVKEKPSQPEPVIKKPFWVPLLVQVSKPQVLISVIVLFLLIVHILFVPPLIIATGLNYSASKQMMDKNISEAEQLTSYAQQSIGFSEWFYQYARPTLLLFSLASFPDNAYEINKTVNRIIRNATELEEQGKKLTALFFKKNKTQYEVESLHKEITGLSDDITTLNEDLSVLEEKIPAWSDQMTQVKQNIREANALIDSAHTFLPFFDEIFAKNEKKTYLLLFANNMELRPGGGFIGSFGTITMDNYSIEEIKVYDVYDADGQLKAHVRPPDAIRDHLNQPHWFLRDSAFSPDFYTNYEQAQFFLEKEMGMTEFDGSILLTTTAIQHVLDAVGDLYIPEFRETVNADNFYIKAQLYAEEDFFPGSLQKKRFLGSVLNQLLLQLEFAPVDQVLEAIKQSFNEKQIVAYFDDPELQQIIDDLYWSGRTITPSCPVQQTENCIVDYIFPYDANLGVNKANFFISRTKDLHVRVSENGTIQNTYATRIVNDSFEDIFPGGRYKNYFQLLLPSDARIDAVRVDETTITDYDESTDTYKKIGFLMTVPPKSEKTIEIVYTLNAQFQKGSGIYQLVMQKQIGSPNSDFQFMIELPETMYMVEKNFTPLVNNNTILYNSTLSTDKIFVLEFFKE